MSTTDSVNRDPPSKEFKPSFYFWMILVMCFFVFAGFGMNSAIPWFKGSFPPAPPIVHIHGFISATWMLLLLAQTSLVSSGNITLHRSLGMYGIAHAATLVYTGGLLQLLGSAGGLTRGGTGAFEGVYLGGMAVCGFALMFILAMRNTRRANIHRRMMLFAMLPVLPPGVNRFWYHALGLNDFFPTFWLYLTLWCLAAAILIHEWHKTRQLSGYSLLGSGWIFLQGSLHEVALTSEMFQEFSRMVLSLAQYR
jgi:lysylphosphatidylglycerol synthetase-like protein (DUF2156 family)